MLDVSKQLSLVTSAVLDLDSQYPAVSLDFLHAKHHVFATQQARANAEHGVHGVPAKAHQVHKQEQELELAQMDPLAPQAKLSHVGIALQA